MGDPASIDLPDGTAASSCILTVNAGSSTLRWALYKADSAPQLLWRGKVDRIGTTGTHWIVRDHAGVMLDERDLVAADHGQASNQLLDWLERQAAFPTIGVVAHRVVHGMGHAAPAIVIGKLLDELRHIAPFDPEHLPFEIGLIADIQRRHPRLPQVACFDTAFHRGMPQVARRLPIPRRFQEKGVERYGFHGLSYSFLMEELVRLGDPAASRGRVILAHLGNGASMAAVREGRSIDTSMGFTPASGLMMSTRCGDLDAGLGYFLAQTEQMTSAQFHHMVNHQSGLLGVSETSPDVRDLLASESQDPRAAEALAMFCYQAKKYVGAYAAALGGLDTLVFSGGVGENAPAIRARVCDGLEFLGIQLEAARNSQGAAIISSPTSRVMVRVIHSDEEQMLARAALPFLPQSPDP